VQVGACGKISHRLRDEDFPWRGAGGDTRAGVDGNTADLVTDDLAFPDVDTGTDLDSQCPYAFADRGGATNSSGGTLEGGEEAVAGVVDLVAAVGSQLSPHECVVVSEHARPALIAQLEGMDRGVDDVGKEDGEEAVTRSKTSEKVAYESRELFTGFWIREVRWIADPPQR
jgi:hypothetical protein